MMAAIDATIIKKQLEEMHEEGIITSSWATETPPPGLIDVFVLRPHEWYEAGAALARYTILNSEGEATVLYFNQSVFTFAPVFGEGFQKTLEAECPKCSFQPNGHAPRRNRHQAADQGGVRTSGQPSVDWVLFAYGAMNVGVPQALQAAELSEQANLISQEAQPTNLEYLQAGQKKPTQHRLESARLLLNRTASPGHSPVRIPD